MVLSLPKERRFKISVLKYKPVDSDNILLHLISKRNLVENEKTEQFEEMSIVDSNS